MEGEKKTWKCKVGIKIEQGSATIDQSQQGSATTASYKKCIREKRQLITIIETENERKRSERQ